MAFVVENLRLKELAIIAEQNRPIFDDLIRFLISERYSGLHNFLMESDESKGKAVILKYLLRSLPEGVALYDGVARPYKGEKAKWLLLGWVFRDAPEQRLRPMVASMPGNSTAEKQAYLLNKLRVSLAKIFPTSDKWDWTSISEVVIDRLEGSRRAIKGTLFEVIVRRLLTDLFLAKKAKLVISTVEIKLEGETYDVSVSGSKGQILIPVKTRETMGGGHALLFTRDIHKSISVADAAGYKCIPVIIAESWTGDLNSLNCENFVYINMNPNQVADVEPALKAELEKLMAIFLSIS